MQESNHVQAQPGHERVQSDSTVRAHPLSPRQSEMDVRNYTWSPTEILNWTMMQWLPGKFMSWITLEYRVSLGFTLNTDTHQAPNHHCNGSVKLISTPLFLNGTTTARLP